MFRNFDIYEKKLQKKVIKKIIRRFKNVTFKFWLYYDLHNS